VRKKRCQVTFDFSFAFWDSALPVREKKRCQVTFDFSFAFWDSALPVRES
jgi:hypothetical protein